MIIIFHLETISFLLVGYYLEYVLKEKNVELVAEFSRQCLASKNMLAVSDYKKLHQDCQQLSEVNLFNGRQKLI